MNRVPIFGSATASFDSDLVISRGEYRAIEGLNSDQSKQMSQEILGFLRNIVAAEGRVSQADEKAIQNIEGIFNTANKFSVKKKIQAGWRSLRKTTGKLLSRENKSKETHGT
jgi:hypothetical protein